MPVANLAVRAKGYPKGKWGSQQSFTDCFRVQMTSFNDGPINVLYAVGLPLIGQMYSTTLESHPWALCREYSRIERIAPNSLVWEVECRFETVNAQESETVNENGESQAPSGQEQAQNPLLEIPEIEMDWSTRQEPVTKVYADDSNLPIDPTTQGNYQYGFTSSAGELLDPQPQMEASAQKLTISRNEPLTANHIVIGLQFQSAVNSDTFWDAEPGQAMCKGIKVSRQTKMTPAGQQIIYLRATYNFEFRYPDWDSRPLDNGTYYKNSLNGADNKPIAFKTKDGHPIRGLLDGAGAKLANNAAPHYLGPYRIYRRVPFASLLLPQKFN